MEKYSYFREQQQILTQFVSAFDGCFVYRYTKDFISKEKINVRYVFGPKQRVLYDIVNQAKNITLPVISIEQTNIKRDSSRIQFKDQHIIRSHTNGSNNISRIPSPIPVTLDITVSMVANYKEDIDQIASNIMSWCNPYFIISWKIPEEFGMDFIDELRTEVTWSGSIDFENPNNITNTDKYKIVGNTSFTIKGWIFPSLETPVAPIYVINNNFISVSSGTVLNGYDDYYSLSANDTTDMILISAYPEFTNIFYQQFPIFEDTRIQGYVDTQFTFLGKRFSFDNKWYLSAAAPIPGLIFEEVETIKFPTISAYKIPDSWVTTISDNAATISIEAESLSGFEQFTFVTSNSAGWSTPEHSFVLDFNPVNIFIQPNLYETFLDPTGQYKFIAYQ